MVVIDTHLARGASNGGFTFHDGGGPYGRTKGAKRVVAVAVTGLPVGALVVPASTHENRTSEVMLEHLTCQGVTERLELVLVDRGVTAAGARKLGRRQGLEVRRVGWDDEQPVFRPIRHAWRVEGAHGRLGRARRLAKSFENTTSACRLTRRHRRIARLWFQLWHEGGHRVILRSCEARKRSAVTVMDSLPLADEVEKSRAAEAVGLLWCFRGQLYECLGRRADELFELTDALLCADGPVQTLVGLCLTPEHRRGHGALYDAVNVGRVDVERLRRVLAGLPLSRMFGGRIVLAVDATPWPRPDAETCPERLFCHVYGRTRKSDQFLPGWPYQLVAALESGPTSWTALLDVVRLGPAEDATAVTAAQLRAVVGRLRAAGRWSVGDPPMLVVLDAGYDVHRLAYLLAGLPDPLDGRVRAHRVMLTAVAPPPADGRRPPGRPPRSPPPRPAGRGPPGRPRRHGAVMTLADRACRRDL